MSKVNPRLVYWIAALHDQAQLTAAHRDVLTYLAVKRLDFETGAGYCSVRLLAESRGCHEATVKRALDIAQKTTPPLLKRTRRRASPRQWRARRVGMADALPAGLNSAPVRR